MQPYQKFAGVYDHFEADNFSIRMAEYTLKIFNRFDFDPNDGLDVCCGTGSAIEVFCNHGFRMAGLDRSRPMLAEARKKLKGCGVDLYCQELPHLDIRERGRLKNSLRRQFDFVTSFYDSLNYLLTERALGAAFKAVHRHLRPGGYFVFDMNTPHALKTIWGSPTVHAAVKKDAAFIFRNFYHADAHSADCLATFFVKKGRHWERFDENHTEQGYSDATIKALLRKAGFQIRGYYRCLSFDRPGRTTNRICAVARKPR
jgi:SAM-dependent methyltransferase